MKKIAIIGRPNVGKSSFFNRILKTRDAITSDVAGTTRDAKRRDAIIIDKRAIIVDTGGLDEGNELFDKIKAMSLKAAYDADIILYMVDGRTLPDDEDKKLFYTLQGMGKDIALVVNKLDNTKLEENLWEYQSFGTHTMFAISVTHNRRVTALLQWIHAHLPEEDRIIEPREDEENDGIDEEAYENSPAAQMMQAIADEEEDEFDAPIDEDDDHFEVFGEDEELREPTVHELKMAEDEERIRAIKVAIIGRVNVGKSSLLNALVGEERSVVSATAGTTIDPIDETIEHGDKKITFVDTAGIRRRGKIVGIERYALMRTEEMLLQADIALLVLDASEPFKDLDEKIAGLVDKNRMACLIVLNKWDMTDKNYEAAKARVRDRFKFLHYAPIITISAQTHQRVHKILDMLLRINTAYSQRIPTSRLNEVLIEAIRRHNLPSPNGQRIKIFYATQYEIRPPQIALVMNKPQLLHFSYRRYLTNKLREAFDFEGTPVLFKAKTRGGNES
ncbi:MAG: GTP-binding protein Der [Sulfuricurvum sp. PC08-66]|nr:MAG: GTP-binding protein Der [Sulfuricurvum sp. PC08-66]